MTSCKWNFTAFDLRNLRQMHQIDQKNRNIIPSENI